MTNKPIHPSITMANLCTQVFVASVVVGGDVFYIVAPPISVHANLQLSHRKHKKKENSQKKPSKKKSFTKAISVANLYLFRVFHRHTHTQKSSLFFATIVISFVRYRKKMEKNIPLVRLFLTFAWLPFVKILGVFSCCSKHNGGYCIFQAHTHNHTGTIVSGVDTQENSSHGSSYNSNCVKKNNRKNIESSFFWRGFFCHGLCQDVV